MKKFLFTLALLLTLGSTAEMSAQKHRHTPQPGELVDSTNKDAVEVYSDTTGTAATPTAHGTNDWDDADDMDEHVDGYLDTIFNSMDSKDLTAVIIVLGVVFFVFVLAPVLILVALFYFIHKNRKQRLKLAQMAVEQGQPIPEQLLEDKVNTITDDYQKGLRQCFVGVGLMIFLGLAAEEIGFGIGALVFCIGLGKIVACKMAERKSLNNQDNL